MRAESTANQQAFHVVPAQAVTSPAGSEQQSLLQVVGDLLLAEWQRRNASALTSEGPGRTIPPRKTKVAEGSG